MAGGGGGQIAWTGPGTGGQPHHIMVTQKRRSPPPSSCFPGIDGSVLLDGGSSTAALAELLPRPPDVRGDRLSAHRRPARDRCGITLHLLGGRIRASFVGTLVSTVAVVAAKCIGPTKPEAVPEDAVDLQRAYAPAAASTRPATA